MDRTEKREFVSVLGQVFAETSMVVVAQNNGMTVAEVSELRRRMRASGSTYKVAKNRLAVLALDGTRFTGIAPMLKGPTALAWSMDPVAVAKAAVDYAKTNEKFVVLGGALGTQIAECGWDQGAWPTAVAGRAAWKLLGMIQDPRHADRRRACSTGRTTRTGLRGLCQERTEVEPRRRKRPGTAFAVACSRRTSGAGPSRC